MIKLLPTGPALLLVLALAACGGTSAPVSPTAAASAPPASAATSGASNKPAASASAKPAAAPESAVAKPSGPGLNLAYVAPGTAFFWQWIAYNQGLFQKNGVQVKQPVFVAGTPRLGQALIAGNFDMAGVGLQAAIDSSPGGAHLEAVSALSKYSTMTVTVPPGSPITDLAQLKGKTVGMSQIGDSADAFLGVALRKANLTRNDVTLVQTGSHANTLTQLLAKKIDAGAIANNYAFIGAKSGTKTLIDGPTIGALEPTGSLLVNKSWADSHKQEVLGVLKTMIQAQKIYLSDEASAVKLMQSSDWFRDVAPDILQEIWQADKKTMLEAPLVDPASVQTAIDNEAERNPAVKGLAPNSVYDNSFVQELIDDGFVKSVFPDYTG